MRWFGFVSPEVNVPFANGADGVFAYSAISGYFISSMPTTARSCALAWSIAFGSFEFGSPCGS